MDLREVHELKTLPHHWKRSHPYPCDTPAKPLLQSAHYEAAEDEPVYDIVYLVDEHDISRNINQKVTRNGNTLQRRYAWHYRVADLATFNVGDVPDTIQLHEKVGNPFDNDTFRWEGFMFDIPGGRATCRVSIVAGAGSASDAALTGPGGAGGSNIDRVVGFAGVYPDNRVPYGPVLQVRRDNAYRRLGASLRGPVKVAWHCAYYITKATPVEPTPHAKNATNGSPNSYRHVSNGKSAQGSPDYDQILDQNVDNEVSVGFDGVPWGGMVFGFVLADTIPRSDPNDDTGLEPYDYSAIQELGIEF